MSSVKLIHVLKHLELIDRDVDELRSLTASLASKRTYTHAIRIALELQINHLLNERLKMMELKIKDPPPALQKIRNKEESDPQSRKPFSFQEHEARYLPQLLNPSGDHDRDRDANEKEAAPRVTKKYDATHQAIQVTQGVKYKQNSQALPETGNDQEGSHEDHASQDQPLSSKKRLSVTQTGDGENIKSDIRDFLKNLPTLDY